MENIKIIITIGFLIFAMIMFFWEKWPVAFTAMTVLVGLIVADILEPKEAFAGFTDSAVLLYMAMFIVGDALFLTGAATKLGRLVTKFAKTEKHSIILIMIITGITSGFLSNAGTAAIFIPIIVGISKSAGYSKSRMLMPLVGSTAMGGSLTLLGSPPNLIASAQLEASGYQPFGIFDFTPIALPIFIAGILYYILIGTKLLPQGNDDTNELDCVYNQDIDYSDVPKWKSVMSVVIMVFTVIAMVFEKKIGTPFYVLAWIGAISLVVTKTITGKEALNAIDMSTILLFVGTLSLGIALEKTGAGPIIAQFVLGFVGTNPLTILAAILLICIVLTNFMSNTATGALMAPIGVSIAKEIGADPHAVLLAIVIGCSCSYATPIGSPPNTMVYGIGGYRFWDYVKVGLPLIFINFVLSMILLPILFPFYP